MKSEINNSFRYLKTLSDLVDSAAKNHYRKLPRNVHTNVMMANQKIQKELKNIRRLLNYLDSEMNSEEKKI